MKSVMDVLEYCDDPNWDDGFSTENTGPACDNFPDIDNYPGFDMAQLSAPEAEIYAGCPIHLPRIQEIDESDMSESERKQGRMRINGAMTAGGGATARCS